MRFPPPPPITAGVAQLVEQDICNVQVAGSNPATSSTNEYKEHGGELGSTGWWRMIWLPDDTVQGIAKNEQTTNANDYELAMAA